MSVIFEKRGRREKTRHDDRWVYGELCSMAFRTYRLVKCLSKTKKTKRGARVVKWRLEWAPPDRLGWHLFGEYPTREAAEAACRKHRRGTHDLQAG